MQWRRRLTATTSPGTGLDPAGLTLRRKFVVLLAIVALLLAGSVIKAPIASAHGCTHTSHSHYHNGHYDYYHWHGHNQDGGIHTEYWHNHTHGNLFQSVC